MRLYPDKEAFLRLAASHNIVPVFADLSVDLETPVSLYYKIVGEPAKILAVIHLSASNHF